MISIQKKRKDVSMRTLKSDGDLNAKYPEAIELQKRLFEEECHTIISKGIKNTMLNILKIV